MYFSITTLVSEEEELEGEDLTQWTLGTSDGEQKWLLEINSDSCLSLPTTSAIPE